jgi:carbon storage regulator
MLVITLKVGERVLIGASIIVTLTKVEPGKVRIGIDAPDEIPVHRDTANTRRAARKHATHHSRK